MNYQYCNGETYTIQKGDSLYTISKKYNVPLALILWANPCADIYNLQIGDKVCIPRRVSPIPVYPITQPKEEKAPVMETPEERPMEETVPPNGAPMNGMPMNGTPMNGMPMNGMPMNGTPMNGMPMNETPMNRTPMNRTPMNGTPMNETPMNGMPMNGMPMNETPMNETPMNRTPMNRTPMNGMPLNRVPSDTERPENMVPNGNVYSNQMPVRENLGVSVIEYVVQENDSVQSILDYFEIEFKDLMEFNSANDMILKPGITIRIPQDNEG